MKTIDEIVDGYFEGTLSEQEETALKVFLASPEGQAPKYDEVRAVMGYFAAGRHVILNEVKDLEVLQSLRSFRMTGRGRMTRKGIWRRIAAVAASLAIIVTLGVSQYNKSNVCVSFVDGKKITDKEVVMNDVDNILADLLSDRTDLEELLNDFFDR